MVRTFIISLLFLPLFAACGNNEENRSTPEDLPSQKQQKNDLETAYFASGCFWCVEHIYENVKGVEEAVSGFAGGTIENPGYHEVAKGETDHAETVKVLYDPEKVDFETLVEVYYASQDPTTQGQAPDLGSQYRSIIFYTNEQERRTAQQAKVRLQNSGRYQEPIVTEIEPLDAFYEASEHHQDYVEKHPNKDYVRQVSNPRFERFKETMPEVLK